MLWLSCSLQCWHPICLPIPLLAGVLLIPAIEAQKAVKDGLSARVPAANVGDTDGVLPFKQINLFLKVNFIKQCELRVKSARMCFYRKKMSVNSLTRKKKTQKAYLMNVRVKHNSIAC